MLSMLLVRYSYIYLFCHCLHPCIQHVWYIYVDCCICIRLIIFFVDNKKELVVNKGVMHLFGRRGRGRRRGGSRGIGGIPAVVIPVIVFGGGHQTHSNPNNNYSDNFNNSTSNSTCDSIACTNNSTSNSIARTSKSTCLPQSVSSILALVLLVTYYLDLLT